MNGSYLLDEHLPKWWPAAILHRRRALTVWRIGDLYAPPFQSPDPFLLEWCEAHHFMLITNNRKSMPGHLAAHVAQGRHVPGILTVALTIPIVRLADDLALIAGAGLPDDYRDQINQLPL